MKSFKAKMITIRGQVWGSGIEIPEKAVADFLGKEHKRVVCRLNDSYEFQCALMPMGEGQYFINVNATIRKKLNLREGDEVWTEIKPDESIYGLPMPIELEEVLKLDPDGDRIFHELTPGKQRTLLHLVGLPKSSEIRIKKAMVVVQYLKDVDGKLDFKELNTALKNANRN